MMMIVEWVSKRNETQTNSIREIKAPGTRPANARFGCSWMPLSHGSNRIDRGVFSRVNCSGKFGRSRWYHDLKKRVLLGSRACFPRSGWWANHSGYRNARRCQFYQSVQSLYQRVSFAVEGFNFSHGNLVGKGGILQFRTSTKDFASNCRVTNCAFEN